MRRHASALLFPPASLPPPARSPARFRPPAAWPAAAARRRRRRHRHCCYARPQFLFNTIGCVVFTQDGGITTARQLEVALVFGWSISILVFIFAGISGANINPAVSLALMLTKKISPLRCVAYTVAQCLGAICGAGLVRIMTPALFDKVDGGANEISKSANATEALGVEFGCTFMLVMTVMAATDSARAETNKHISTIAPIIVGLAVTVAHFTAIPVDNCSINPARSFGVSAISGNWNDVRLAEQRGGEGREGMGLRSRGAAEATAAPHTDLRRSCSVFRAPAYPSPYLTARGAPPLSPTQHWVFWLGPYLGATSAAICYTYLFQHELFHAKTLAASASAAPASGGAAPSAELKAQPAPVAVFATRGDGAVEAVESRLPASADTGSEWR